MKCTYCDVEMQKRRATRVHPYVYRQSGLKSVLLSGIEVYACPNCDVEAPIIPKIAQLHESLADEITRLPRLLRGDEVKFLRKHAAMPAQQFAKLIGVRPEHLSRVENGHTRSFGKNTDRLIRALTLTAKKGSDARTTLLDLADRLDHPAKRSAAFEIAYGLKPAKGWQPIAQAA
jgi:DNA-binding transcriptional regulator YiaG